jgi:predicted RNA-binding protein with PUA-like domain
MRRGDRCFFYHSNIGLEIVGIVEVVREAYPDPTAEKGPWVCVDVVARQALPTPVTLKQIKATPALAEMPLVASFRLSVQPVPKPDWDLVCAMGGLDEGKPTPRGRRSKSTS